MGEDMVVIIRVDRDSVEIYELIEERPKTYKVKCIDTVQWANRGYNVLVRKDECVYKGGLSDVAEIVDQWNTETDNRDVLIDSANAKFKLHTGILKDTLIKKSL